MAQSDANAAQISYELMKRTLKCSDCKRLLNVRPIVVNDGNAFCGRCATLSMRFQLNCQTFPQTIYEKLALHLTYPCSYRQSGCQKILAFNDVLTHETMCLFQPMLCPLAYVNILNKICNIRTHNINGHIQQHSEYFLDPPNFQWPEIGQNKVFFTKIGQQIISVVIMYTFHNNYVCHALINGTDLESQCYKYQLELLSKDNVNSVLLRRDRLQPLTVMDNHSHFESRKMSLQVDIAYVSEMLKNPTKIFARMGIVKKSKKQLHQITGRALHDPPSPSAASTCSTEEAAFDEDLLSELECPVCNEYMIAPIFICVTGHSVCNVCKPRLESCPTCKCDFGNGRNFNLEKLATKVSYPCTNRSIGCKFVSTSDVIRSHENSCPLFMTSCFYQCGWKGPSPDLAGHLKDKHNTKQIFDNKEFKICIGTTVPDGLSFIDKNNTLFVVAFTRELAVGSIQGNVKLNIYHVSQMGSVNAFQYNIQFSLDGNQSCPCLQLSNFCDSWTPRLAEAQNWQEKCTIIPTQLLETCLNQSREGYMKINITKK